MDEGCSETSFFALSGWIKSTIDYNQKTTYSEDSKFDFTFLTEHNIPKGGFLTIRVPEEMHIPQKYVDAQDIKHKIPGSLKFESLTETTVSFKVPNGLNTSSKRISISLSNLMTPRSFKPSSDFRIETKNSDGFIVDAGG